MANIPISALPTTSETKDSDWLIIQGEQTQKIKFGDLQSNTVTATKTELETEINAVQANLDTANENLSKSIESTQTDLDGKIETVKKTYLPLSGGTMTGDINIGTGKAFGFPDCAATHNGIFRGKYLGSALTSEQSATITAGVFKDLYIGDYWTINGVNYRIAALDYWYHCGDTNCAQHHALLVPDSALYTYHMNAANTTEGGYIGSDMYKNGLTQANTTIKAAFGDAHILYHRQHFTNAVTDGIPSGGTWYDDSICLMNEAMVYGTKFFSCLPTGTNWPNNYTIDQGQLPLFNMAPWFIHNRQDCWLRDVVSASGFANVHWGGRCSAGSASDVSGVRPAFAIY